MSDEVAVVLSIFPKIVIYGRTGCDQCDRAKTTFDAVELPYEVRMLDDTLFPKEFPKDWEERGFADLRAMWEFLDRPVPLIVIDGQGFPSLVSALPVVNYVERRRIIQQRKIRR